MSITEKFNMESYETSKGFGEGGHGPLGPPKYAPAPTMSRAVGCFRRQLDNCLPSCAPSDCPNDTSCYYHERLK